MIKSLMSIHHMRKKLNQIPLWKKNELLLLLIISIKKGTHNLPNSIYLLIRIFLSYLLTSIFIFVPLRIIIFTILNIKLSLILNSTLKCSLRTKTNLRTCIFSNQIPLSLVWLRTTVRIFYNFFERYMINFLLI